MEEAPGIELERVWPEMDIKARLAVVKAIAGYQKAWTDVSFTKFGSLYFAADLEISPKDHALYVDADGTHVMNRSYAIGPSTGRENIDDGRSTVDFDRGPCKLSCRR